MTTLAGKGKPAKQVKPGKGQKKNARTKDQKVNPKPVADYCQDEDGDKYIQETLWGRRGFY